MANRHLSRSVVLQTLFEWDFHNKNGSFDLKEILERNLSEYAPGTGDDSFARELLEGVVGKTDDINSIIVKAAPDWPLDQISFVDRNILRIGLFELLFSDPDQVPPKVAINESIELAKSFGGETSGRFVNGVLGAVYREMGEPGKNDKPKPQKEVPQETHVGGLVYSIDEGKIFLAFVHDIFGYWTLSKGKVLPDEKPVDALVRDVKEELGLKGSVGEKLGENSYIAHDPEEGKKQKNVGYYLVEAEHAKLTLKESGGLDDAKWFPLEGIDELNFYGDMLPLITKGVEMIAKITGK
jgi:transcription antitermination protein NusB